MISNSFFPFKRCLHVPKTKALEADCRKSPIEAGDSLFRSLLHLFAEIEKTEKQRSQEQNEKTFVRKWPKRQTTSHNYDKTAQCLVIHMPSRVNVDLSDDKKSNVPTTSDKSTNRQSQISVNLGFLPFVLHSHLWHREPLKHPHLAHHDLTWLPDLTEVNIYKLTANQLTMFFSTCFNRTRTWSKT